MCSIVTQTFITELLTWVCIFFSCSISLQFVRNKVISNNNNKIFMRCKGWGEQARRSNLSRIKINHKNKSKKTVEKWNETIVLATNIIKWMKRMWTSSQRTQFVVSPLYKQHRFSPLLPFKKGNFFLSFLQGKPFFASLSQQGVNEAMPRLLWLLANRDDKHKMKETIRCECTLVQRLSVKYRETTTTTNS